MKKLLEDIAVESGLDSLEDLIKVQGSDGNWNYDPYMQGLYNGLIVAKACFTKDQDVEKQFKSAPEEWLKDKGEVKESILINSTNPLLERAHSMNEDWKKNLATGVIATSLAFGGAGVADAKPKVTPKKQEHHHGLEHKQYSQKDVIDSIIGEAGGEGYQGMLAIACAIRNRMKNSYYKDNFLHGVFGRTNPSIGKASSKLRAEALRAWEESRTKDITNGAFIWGNSSDLQKFKTQKWFNNVEWALHLGNHYFFRMRTGR